MPCGCCAKSPPSPSSTQLDATGKERLRVSRLAMDVVASGSDLSNDPKFSEAVARKVYYGPVYFRRESEPYMTLAIAGTRRDAGVSVAEVNLKLIWDVVTQIKVGERGHAYVVDAQGRLIAHPDISLVLRNTDMSRLAQVRAARAGTGGSPSEETVQEAENIEGRKVLTASAPVAPLGWLVFVELPAEEAYAPLYDGVAAAGLRAAGRAVHSPCLPGCFSPAAWSARSRHCEPAPRGSAAAISASASRSRPGTNSKRLPTSSTIWPDN